MPVISPDRFVIVNQTDFALLFVAPVKTEKYSFKKKKQKKYLKVVFLNIIIL